MAGWIARSCDGGCHTLAPIHVAWRCQTARLPDCLHATCCRIQQRRGLAASTHQTIVPPGNGAHCSWPAAQLHCQATNARCCACTGQGSRAPRRARLQRATARAVARTCAYAQHARTRARAHALFNSGGQGTPPFNSGGRVFQGHGTGARHQPKCGGEALLEGRHGLLRRTARASASGKQQGRADQSRRRCPGQDGTGGPLFDIDAFISIAVWYCCWHRRRRGAI